MSVPDGRRSHNPGEALPAGVDSGLAEELIT
jgi:hypothetical protein